MDVRDFRLDTLYALDEYSIPAEINLGIAKALHDAMTDTRNVLQMPPSYDIELTIECSYRSERRN